MVTQLTYHCSVDDIEDDAQLRRGVPGQLRNENMHVKWLKSYSITQDIWHTTDNQLSKLCILSCLSATLCSAG